MLLGNAAFDSAQRYYHYLEVTGGGLVKTGIVRIEKYARKHMGKPLMNSGNLHPLLRNTAMVSVNSYGRKSLRNIYAEHSRRRHFHVFEHSYQS